MRPWLVINQFPYVQGTEEETLDTLKDHLTQTLIESTHEHIKIEGLHRKHTNLPTTLILFKTTDNISEQTLLNTKLRLNNKIHNIRKYIDKTQTQCTKCKKIGHLKASCTNKYACGRCGSESCPPKNFDNYKCTL